MLGAIPGSDRSLDRGSPVQMRADLAVQSLIPVLPKGSGYARSTVQPATAPASRSALLRPEVSSAPAWPQRYPARQTILSGPASGAQHNQTAPSGESIHDRRQA